MDKAEQPTIRIGGSTLSKAPIRFPMAMFAPHNRQAQRNHGGQSLARLEERGGLSWCEAAAILQDRDWHKMEQDFAEATVRAFYDKYSTTLQEAIEQPTITQADYTVADYELAEQCVSAANVVTCGGYYELDIERVAETLAKARTTSLAAQDGLVEALERIEAATRNDVRAGQKGYVSRYGINGIARKALSAIKEQHHD